MYIITIQIYLRTYDILYAATLVLTNDQLQLSLEVKHCATTEFKPMVMGPQLAIITCPQPSISIGITTICRKQECTQPT